MNNEQKIASKSETIGAAEVRKLKKITGVFAEALTIEEYIKISMVYAEMCERILKENGLE